MATTAPTPLFHLGNVAQYTKVNAQADDTNLFALGNIFSILEYGGGVVVEDINTVKLRLVILDLVELASVGLIEVLNIII